MAQPYVMADQFSGDANAAVIDYSAQFATALEAGAAPVAEQFSAVRENSNLITRWYIPLHAAGYTPFEGTLPFRTLSKKFFDISIEKWADGVAEDADTVEDNDFGGFAMSPQTMAKNAMVFPDKKIAALINDGENQSCWDGTNFLAASGKPVNAFDATKGTYGNLTTSHDLTLANLQTSLTSMLGRKGADGESLGLLGTHLLLPTALYETGRVLCAAGFISDGSTTIENPLKGRLQPVHWPQLAANRWAIVDDSRADLKPFAIARRDGGMPEMIEHGKDSSLYKTSLKVGFNAVIRMGFALAMPQAIEVGETS